MNSRTTTIENPSTKLLEWARAQEQIKDEKRDLLSKKLHQEKQNKSLSR